jgi:hypothetical protein
MQPLTRTYTSAFTFLDIRSFLEVLGLLREERNNFQENAQEPGKYL